jgi:hypothetical protein
VAQAERLGVSVEEVRGGVESSDTFGTLWDTGGVREGGRVSGFSGEHRSSEVQNEPSYGFACADQRRDRLAI